jgi:hypothetical protein
MQATAYPSIVCQLEMDNLHESYFNCNSFIHHPDKRVRIAAFELLIAATIQFVYGCKVELLEPSTWIYGIRGFKLNTTAGCRTRSKRQAFRREAWER